MEKSYMKSKRVGMVALTVMLLAFVAGCSQEKIDADLVKMGWKKSEEQKRAEEAQAMPSDLRGTIAEVATLVSSGQASVSNWGVVVGLGANGSSEVPPNLKRDLVKYLKSWIRIGRATFDTGSISVADFLDDKDTAIVRVETIIPPGAPKGTKLDVAVSAAPRTQTISLKGGVLLPRELAPQRSPQQGTGTTKVYVKSYAQAEGAIFVNPFIDPTKPAAMAKFRQGRILNGAVTTRDMPLRLQLYQSSYHRSHLLQRRINERFPCKGQKVASAKTSYYLDIKIPPEYRDNYRYFLQLLMHLPRRGGTGAYSAHAHRIVKAMGEPGANFDGLALIWEAMGRQILPIVQKQYSSSNPAVAYYSARAGLRLGNEHLAGPVVLRFAQSAGSQHQLAAIEELGRHASFLQAGPVLRKLLDDPNDMVRIAAYEALVKRGDFSAMQRHLIDVGLFQDDQPSFTVDIVDSGGGFVVYATRTGRPKIVLFGRKIPIANPMFYSSPDELVTVFSKKKDLTAKDPDERKDHIVVYRKLSNSNEISKKFRIGFSVWELIRTMGATPRPSVETGQTVGLGLTYSQVVGTLCRMCKQKSIPAKFVLQPLPEMQRIYRTAPSVGRPD